jgi:cyclopropane fatty-acyl-phospholipid synthase-like methyltransferase
VTNDPRVELVARGYDEIADRFAAWRVAIEGDPTDRYLTDLAQRLPPGARVLELGCGDGEAATRALSARYRVTAVDVSRVQVERAQRAAPGATVIEGDVLEIRCDPGSFDAVCSFNVLNHIPREKLGDLLDGIAVWLDAGGLLVASFGTGDLEAWTGTWLGAETFFSSWTPEVNRSLVEGAGLEIVSDELVTIVEGEPEPGEVTFQWILARR